MLSFVVRQISFNYVVGIFQNFELMYVICTIPKNQNTEIDPNLFRKIANFSCYTLVDNEITNLPHFNVTIAIIRIDNLDNNLQIIKTIIAKVKSISDVSV